MTVRVMILSVLLPMICATAARAHEGKTHVMGTISVVDTQHVVVTDRDGKTVSIALTKDTKYEQGDAPAAASALKAGARVVVDVTGQPESLTATEIRIAPAAPANGHEGAGPHGGEHDHN